MRNLFLSAAVAACVLAGPSAATAFQTAQAVAPDAGVTVIITKY